jgi:N-acetylglucosamine-6-phosphate deacetylase
VGGGRVTGIGPGLDGDEVLDASGCLVAPGFVDLQCNGAGGIHLTEEPERIAEVAALLPRWGVTSWLPTIVTAPRVARDRALAAILEVDLPPGAAAPLGLHLEGPFLSPARAGAHPPDLLVAPDAGEAAGWSPARGVALVTLAPELDGALDVTAGLADRGVVVSVGHTAATRAQAAAAVDAGARWVTHLFNAMEGLHHREPGVPGLALTDERLRFGLIADGLHVDPAVVAVAWRSARDRLVLVTDAVAALGAPGHVPGSGVRLPDGTLAGSDLSMDAAVRNLRAWTGCSAEEAIGAATSAPAAVLGLSDRGRLAVGSVADAVVLDDHLDVVATVVAGVVVRP